MSALSYDDVFLRPQYSTLSTRNEAAPMVQFGGLILKTPIISSNMDTVTDSNMAIEMFKCGGIGALHRFNSVYDNVREYRKVRSSGADCLVSIGVKPEDIERAVQLYESGARYFIIDIAHGHSMQMVRQIQALRTSCPDSYIVAGNVATREAVIDLARAGASCLKVGVGGGAVCQTRVVTGHGVPNFTCVLECSEAAREVGVKVIADGGIKNSGDIAKAIVAGADAVMLGSLLAGTDSAPGERFFKGDVSYKSFRGMASQEVYDEYFGQAKSGIAAEGISTSIKCTGPTAKLIDGLTGGLRSAMSYSNARTLAEFKKNAVWGVQTLSAYIEGTPHVNRGQ